MKDKWLDQLRENSATVAALIDHLEKNFSPNDRLCRMDCVEGVRNDCVYVKKCELGNTCFRYVGDDRRKAGCPGEDNIYGHAEDCDVLIV